MSDHNKVTYDQYGNPIMGSYSNQGYGYNQGYDQGYPQQNVYVQQNSYGQQPAYAQPIYGNIQNSSQAPAPTVHVSPIKPQEEQSNGWRDVPFAILFIINIIVIGGLMVIWGFSALDNDSSSSSNSFLSGNDAKTVAGIAAGLCVVAALITILVVRLIITFAKFAITFSLWFNVFLSFAFAFLGFAIGSAVVGVIGLIFALLTLCYAYMVRHRIPFATANLKTAASAVKKHGTLHFVAVLLLVLQIVWIIMWSLAFLGVLDQVNDVVNSGGASTNSVCRVNADCASNICQRDSSSTLRCRDAALKNTSYVAYFFMLVSLFWGMLVFQNIVHVTVAGTVASWWFNADSSGSTGASLKRSFTTSLGSICLGSLIVAILKALRQIAEEASREGDIGACIAACCLSCLESLMEYFNRWAFVYVGVYGYKFTTAGKAVISLFKQRGFDAIINDDLVGNALSFAAIAVGLLCSGLAVGFHYIDTSIVDFDNAAIVMGILGFCVGLGIALIPLSVIDSAVATVFVCFAEDPAVFSANHPELYAPLVEAWYGLYPDVMVAGGYRI